MRLFDNIYMILFSLFLIYKREKNLIVVIDKNNFFSNCKEVYILCNIGHYDLLD
jgi:hypothetical protein